MATKIIPAKHLRAGDVHAHPVEGPLVVCDVVTYPEGIEVFHAAKPGAFFRLRTWLRADDSVAIAFA
jgi:hypothetical protein